MGDRFDELLELSRLQSLFSDDKINEAIEATKTDAQKMADRIRAGEKVGRAIRQQKTAVRPKQHWRAKKRWRKNYYREVIVPKNRQRRAEMLEGKSWDLMEEYWKRKSVDYTITQKEWEDNVEEYVEGKVIYVNRYDTTKPISLDNIIVRDTRTRAVLFDGAECRLRKMGYIV